MRWQALILMWPVARTDAACLIGIHLKRISYQEALRSGRLSLDGPPQLTGAFLTWIRPSPYADVAPARYPRRPQGPHQLRPPRAVGQS